MDMNRYSEIRDELEIDKLNLDEILERQSVIFEEISDLAAQAISLRDEAKDKLNRTDARLYSVYRRRLEKKGDRVTEAMINNAVLLDKKRIKASKDYNDAREQADKLIGLKESWRMRSHAIGQLCDLYQSNYFERKAVKGGAKTEEFKYKRRREEMSENRKRKRVRAK